MALSKNKNKNSDDYSSKNQMSDEEIELDTEDTVADDDYNMDNSDTGNDQDDQDQNEAGSRISSFDSSKDVQIELDTKVEHEGKFYRGVQKVSSDLADTLLEIDKTNIEERNI